MYSSVLEKLKIITKLQQIYFEFGILSEDKDKVEKVTIYDLDDSTYIENMTLSDIMYFTEYGTITIPAKNILKRLARKISEELSRIIKQITIVASYEDITEKQIVEKLNEFNEYINKTLIPKTFSEYENDSSYVTKILKEDNQEKSIFSLKKLKKYIKCKIIF